MKQVLEIGKTVKKTTKKDKRKLGELAEAIEQSKPTGDKYMVATVDFYGAPPRHFVITPITRPKILTP